MGLTPQVELRKRIIAVLQSSPARSLRRAEVLDAMEAEYGALWSEDDLEAPESRPWESKWRNRASFERAQMVRDGLLAEDTPGYWTLRPHVGKQLLRD